jgi:mRNA interferase MazF
VICDPWDVVIVPFPFTDKAGVKRRPALVLSATVFNENGHTVFAMITTKSHSPWPGDTVITALATAGLHTPCLVRLKLFTLDNQLLVRRSGHLSEADRTSVAAALNRYLIFPSLDAIPPFGSG